MSIVAIRRGSSEVFGRDDSFGKIVQTSEIVGPSRRRDSSAIEEVLERDLGVVPIPPWILLGGAFAQITGCQRALSRHASQHFVDITRSAATQITRDFPWSVVMRLHLPSPQSMMFGGNVRRGVGPVLEQSTRGRGLRNRRTVMRTETREEREFLTAHQHVDRVDLHHTHGADGAHHVRLSHPPGRTGACETLRGQRDASRLVDRQMSTRFSRRR